jgi:cell wall-associated NlpC family hydrolase
MRPIGALCVAAAVGSTLLASAGGSRKDVGADVVQIARQQIGDTYQWGGNGPDAWDCSGFTSRLWREVGGVTSIPRVSRDQQPWAVPIPLAQIQLGDLVFWGHPVTHVGIYSGMGKMIDASSANGGVVERPIWRTGIFRFGRVPRPGMPKVKPWTPPPLPQLKPPATSRPAGPPTSRPSVAVPVPVAFAGPPLSRKAAAAVAPLKGLPAPTLPASSRLAARAAFNAKTVNGSRRYDDLSLVRVAWHHSGGGILPATRPAIEAFGVAVPLKHVRVGDLVVYGRAASHLGIYLGHGYMVDASPTLKRVVTRRVFSTPTVRFVRLPNART